MIVKVIRNHDLKKLWLRLYGEGSVHSSYRAKLDITCLMLKDNMSESLPSHRTTLIIHNYTDCSS